MSYLKAQQLVVTDREADPLLDRVRLNIAVRTETPLLVQNNIAKVEGNVNVRLVGPFKEPSMVGRITLEDGGEIILNRQEYYINRGTIILANQARLEPELDIRAQTKTSNYDITLQLTGRLERLDDDAYLRTALISGRHHVVAPHRQDGFGVAGPCYADGQQPGPGIDRRAGRRRDYR